MCMLIKLYINRFACKKHAPKKLLVLEEHRQTDVFLLQFLNSIHKWRLYK